MSGSCQSKLNWYVELLIDNLWKMEIWSFVSIWIMLKRLV